MHDHDVVPSRDECNYTPIRSARPGERGGKAEWDGVEEGIGSVPGVVVVPAFALVVTVLGPDGSVLRDPKRLGRGARGRSLARPARRTLFSALLQPATCVAAQRWERSPCGRRSNPRS